MSFPAAGTAASSIVTGLPSSYFSGKEGKTQVFEIGSFVERPFQVETDESIHPSQLPFPAFFLRLFC